MRLIKFTEERKREVWLLDDRYRKIWRYVKSDLLKRHVDLLNLVFPGYILNNGIDENSMWVDYKIIEGVSANAIELTDENIERIYRFCINNLESTAPFYHGDWQLSNMIVNGDDITLIDWDNINTDTRDDMMIKMHFDLRESIGQRFDKFIDQRYLPRKIYKNKILNNIR
jgi:RIO-like serine/threonine protein kinase